MAEVKPSSYLVFNKEGIKEYFITELSLPKLELSPETWLTKLDETIERVVSEELVSDVPIASLLSGGVDSAIISYYASKISKLSLFTVKMSDGIDESEIASRVAKHIGAKHEIVKSDFPKLELVVDF